MSNDKREGCAHHQHRAGVKQEEGDAMIATAIPGTVGVYSVHEAGQRLPEGIGVYHYASGNWWSCEVHKAWRPWLPGQGVPCACICLVLEGKERRTK